MSFKPVFLRSAGVAVLTAVLSGTVAHAGVQLDGRIDGFRLTLVDLDPADGITPALRFVEGRGSVGDVLFAAPGAWQEQGFDSSAEGGPMLRPDVAAVSGDGFRAEAAVEGDGRFESAATRIAVGLDGHAGGFEPTRLRAGTAMPNYGYVFELTPATGVTWTGDVRLAGQLLGAPEDGLQQEGQAWATASMQLRQPGRVRNLQQAYEIALDGVNTIDEGFSLSVANDSDERAWLDLSAYLAGEARIADVIPSIPEPGAALCLLVGLAALGGVRRRARG